jgi:hypothetical protein
MVSSASLPTGDFSSRGTLKSGYTEIDEVNTYCRTFGASSSAVSRTCRGT